MSTQERIATIPISEVENEIEELVAKAAALRDKLQEVEDTARQRELLLRLIAERGWDATVFDLKGLPSPVAIQYALADGSSLTVRGLLGRMERRGWTTRAQDKIACLRSLLQRAEELGIVRPGAAGSDGSRTWEAIPKTEMPAPTEADTGSQVTAVA